MHRKENWRAACPSRYAWGHHHLRPPRHWFFARICLLIFLSVCVALLLIGLFSNDGFSFQQLRHISGWIFVVLLASFFILRRLFLPMRRLLYGVQEIADGNLEFQFKTGRHGEFNYLAQTFNVMVQRVREMLQAKSQLLLDVSHELRSPLTRLRVALEMMPRHRLKESMLSDIAQMETMLTEILEAERLRSSNGQLTLTRVNLSAVVRDVARRYKRRKPGVKLLKIPKDVRINADEARIKIVLQNILENALKYSTRQAQPVEIALACEAAYIELTIRDFGVGIPSAEQEKVFEPFYRVDKSRTKKTGGYGLGLSLCQQIMQAHGGEIRLQSQPDFGTSVTLRFPLEERQSESG